MSWARSSSSVGVSTWEKGEIEKSIADYTTAIRLNPLRSYAAYTGRGLAWHRQRKYKLIWNIAWRMEYPFASDLWAASTWQEVYRNHKQRFGRRAVEDYLKAIFKLQEGGEAVSTTALASCTLSTASTTRRWGAG